jgi:hypothetical protein
MRSVLFGVLVSVLFLGAADVSLAQRLRLESRAVMKPKSALPFVLPKPRQAPRFVVDPSYTGDVAENDLATHTVTSASPLGRQDRAHERFHTLDYDQFTAADRARAARIIAPARAREASSDWWGATGDAAGGRPGLAELAADYYAAAITNMRVRPKRQDGMKVSAPTSAYAHLQPRRLKKFKRFLDEWGRGQLGPRPVIAAPAPTTEQEALAQAIATEALLKQRLGQP